MGQIFNGVTQTVHASCYDINNKELLVNVQERDVSFHFSLDGGFREANTGHKALDLYVNGDNVGLASSCNAENSSWTYTSGSPKGTLSLKDNVAYSITGDDLDNVIIEGGKEG